MLYQIKLTDQTKRASHNEGLKDYQLRVSKVDDLKQQLIKSLDKVVAEYEEVNLK